MHTALENAQTLCWKIIEGEPAKSIILKVALKLIGLMLEADYPSPAKDLFIKIEKETAKLVDLENGRFIDNLVALGSWYQEHDRWSDAEPHFEHALAISMRLHDLDGRVVQILELALEKQHFTPVLQSVESARAAFRDNHIRRCGCGELMGEFFGSRY